MEVAKVPSFQWEGYNTYRAGVLILDAATSLGKKRRAGALILQLEGQSTMLLAQMAGSAPGLEGSGATGGRARGARKFLEILDLEYLEDAGGFESKEIRESLEIRRHGHFVADFVTRVHLAFDKCSAHSGGSDPEPLPGKFASAR